MTNFTLPVIDLATFGEISHNFLRVSVSGFWSEPISIEICRRDNTNNKWEFNVTHSSGAYDNGDKLAAEENFANALVASIKLVREIESYAGTLEANYQRKLAADTELYLIKEAEKQAKIDAGPAIGKDQAKKMVKLLKESKGTHYLEMFKRGEDEYHRDICYVTQSGRLELVSSVNRGRAIISIENLIDLLAQHSQRSMLCMR